MKQDASVGRSRWWFEAAMGKQYEISSLDRCSPPLFDFLPCLEERELFAFTAVAATAHA